MVWLSLRCLDGTTSHATHSGTLVDVCLVRVMNCLSRADKPSTQQPFHPLPPFVTLINPQTENVVHAQEQRAARSKAATWRSTVVPR